PDGKEIGRAQAEQARACGIEPSVFMNPVLLKPSTDKMCQVVVMGKPVAELSAMEFQKYKKNLVKIVRSALERLIQENDCVVIEGAGSPAEINLKKGDIVNMAVAKMVQSPVILVGDIDKGGVFAQLVGTYQILQPEEKRLVKAFLINKFRGDRKILDPGLRWIEKKTGKKILGVIPFIPNLRIAQEDSVILEESNNGHKNSQSKILVEVVRFPRISNFTDFESLSKEPDVQIRYIDRPPRHSLPDLLILPGTKSTMADLEFLKASGLAHYLKRCVRAEVPLVGICGGYQMLGERLLDPHHLESKTNESEGLGLVPSITVFEKKKRVAQVKAVHVESGIEIEGYEIHMGCTQGRNGQKPLFKIVERHGMAIEDYDGISETSVFGTYIHGLFDNAEFRRYFLDQVRQRSGLSTIPQAENKKIAGSPNPYDALSHVLEKNIDKNFLEKILCSR
ncbi:MAG: cobyric acid synthase, partial [Elusimicrobia bacterium]|nr:cobyric acid synthase [Elusimicrobiota bacterium]